MYHVLTQSTNIKKNTARNSELENFNWYLHTII